LIKFGDIVWGDCPLFMAPMEDITDSPYRQVCREYGADVVVTEFISSEGLVRDARKSLSKMQFSETERPVGVQIFGHDIESMKRAAAMAEEVHPDFIDLNYGCPVRKVVSKGGGAALLKDLPKMEAMTRAVVSSTRLPVTAKTRLGWDDSSRNIMEITERLQDAGICAIAIHARTKVQMYGGKADWKLIGVVKNNPSIHIPVIGNGDITGAVIAKEMKEKYGVDGLMIGRAAIGNPWIFREIRMYLQNGELLVPPSLKERITTVRSHLQRSVACKGDRRTVFEMRKFYSGYFRGLPDFKKIRMALVTAGSLEEIEKILDEIR
jgi:tRNA-dihydrouridine synthase B